MKKFITAALFAAGAFTFSTAHAADCKTDIKKADLKDKDVQMLYDCIKTSLREGYAAKGGKVATDYQSWKAASTIPGAPGAHSKRFLMTFVNEIGYDEYVKYSDENPTMPVGTIIAKESFGVSKKGKVKKGPLLIMTKVAKGEAKKYGDWVYTGFTPKGKEMKVSQAFCHGCHGNYDDQDFLGYPIEEYRVSQ